MGVVWRAKDVMLDREVAVKEVTFGPGLSGHEKDVLKQRTLREARASARLNHPNVVTVHDVVEEDGRPWIVMEFVDADSLQDILDIERIIEPWRAAEIGRHVISALKAAHERGILHRDVKPSNILITKNSGRVVLTDFGIAQMEGDVTLTQTGLVMGSPAYIPPERVQGERAVPASDLWSLGATLFAAVEGHAPFERADAMAALSAALSEPVPRPRQAGQLTRVLEGLLVREPAARMTSEQALPLLQDVSASRPNPIPLSQATQFDETILDRPSERPPVAGAMETILDPAQLGQASMQIPQAQRPQNQGPQHQPPHRRPEVEPEARTILEPQAGHHLAWRDDQAASFQQPSSPFGGYSTPAPYQPPDKGNRTTIIIVLSIVIAVVALALVVYIVSGQA
ncbi:protein kinase domain-containing protein [Actinocorallia longicatena]